MSHKHRRRRDGKQPRPVAKTRPAPVGKLLPGEAVVDFHKCPKCRYPKVWPGYDRCRECNVYPGRVPGVCVECGKAAHRWTALCSPCHFRQTHMVIIPGGD